MPAPYSNDLRKRIIESKLKGIPESPIAADKNVHKSTITKLWALYRETGSYEPRPNPNCRKPVLSTEQLENVRNIIIDSPDITLRELIERHSLPIGISGLCKIVKKLGFRYKKTLYSSEQQREYVKIEREEYTARQPEMETNNLIFIDESSSNTGMTRQYGRALDGERVVDYAPAVRFERITMLSSVCANGEIVPCIFKGSLNGEIFREYITKFLAPTLKPGDIVVMDNLCSHKVKGVAEAINMVYDKENCCNFTVMIKNNLYFFNKLQN